MSEMNANTTNRSEDEALAIKIKNDLNDYFRFVALSKIKRSHKNNRLIEEYVKRQANIMQRIHFIEELDREEQFAHKISPQLTSEEIKKARQKEQAKKKQTKISKSSFFTYLFSTRTIIKNFGTRTNILKSGFFNIRLTGDSEHYYKTILSRSTALLLKSTNFLVEHGWKTLDRLTYNVIIAFSRFIKQFVQAGNILALEDITSIHNKLNGYILPYLQITSKRIYKDLLKEAFYEILYFEGAFKADFRDMVDTLNELMDTDSRGMRFFNVLLGIYMIQFKHFVTHPVMLNHYKVQEIDDSQYDFSPKIRQYIVEQIESNAFKNTEIEEKLYYLRFIDEGFSFKAKIEDPLTHLFGRVFFYNRMRYPMSFGELLKDENFRDSNFLDSYKNNITPMIIQYVKGFLSLYERYLRGRVTVKGKDNIAKDVTIFSESYFGKELGELSKYQSELESLKDVNAFLSIPYDTYERFNRTGRTELEKEEKLCRHFQNIVGLIYELSVKASNTLYRNYTSGNLTGDQKLELDNTKNKPVEQYSMEPRLLPRAVDQITGDPYLEGQIVINVLTEITIFAGNFANLLRYESVSQRLVDKQKHLLKSEEYLKLKSKIND